MIITALSITWPKGGIFIKTLRDELTVNTMDCHRLTDMREALATPQRGGALKDFVLSDASMIPPI